MIDRIVGLFGCAHRRLTRPITPVSKGVPSGETYVVCLDCGKQFAYDWDQMRIGKALDQAHDQGVLHPEMPSAAKSKIKYALLGSAVPLAILLSGLLSKRRDKTAPAVNSSIGNSPELEKSVGLPHGGPEAHFRAGDLVRYFGVMDRDYIIIGEVDCAFADHPRPRSLDYWLRKNFARNKESKQATPQVISQLLATGLFEESDSLRCPDTGHKSAGLRLKSV